MKGFYRYTVICIYFIFFGVVGAAQSDSLEVYTNRELYDKIVVSWNNELDSATYIYSDEVYKRYVNNFKVSDSLVVLSGIYKMESATNLDRYVEARSIGLWLLDKVVTVYGEASYFYVQVLYLLSHNAIYVDDFRLAMSYIEKAESLVLGVTDSSDELYTSILRQKGDLYTQFEQLDSAEFYLNRSLSLASKQGGAYCKECLKTESKMARLYYMQNKMDECFRLSTRIVTICEEQGFEHLEVYSDMLFCLTLMNLESNQVELATLYFEKLSKLNTGTTPKFSYDSKLLELAYHINTLTGNIDHCIEISKEHLRLIDLLKAGNRLLKVPQYERLAVDYTDKGLYSKVLSIKRYWSLIYRRVRRSTLG